ncbi:hypothetical protein LAZ67_14002190, partial [Cordylochernes scorpioides]
MPRKRSEIGVRTPAARRMAARAARGQSSRTLENPQQSQARLQSAQLRHRVQRASETSQQSQTRHEADRLGHFRQRASTWADILNAAFHYNPALNYEQFTFLQISHMDKQCLHCTAFKYNGERPGMCCSAGKVRIPDLPEPPEALRTLLDGSSPHSAEFMQRVRHYNNAFQMTSFGCGSRVVLPGYMPTFKVQGQVYHRIGSVLPPLNSDSRQLQPAFLQVFFIGDSSAEVATRHRNFPITKPHIFSIFQDMLHRHNPSIENMPSPDYKLVIKADKAPPGHHPRTFNAPTVNEVAIVIVQENCDRRDIVLSKRGSDCMAYVRKYGRPCLFITFTCNPEWPEIKLMQFPTQSAFVRHDLVARIFQLKVTKLIDLITKGDVFGKPQCWCYTIEWQKRGLPHAHILLWLKEKIRPNQIDSIICAEIPNEEVDASLFRTLTKNMIHGSCGHGYLNPGCMERGRCQKKYPRLLLAETQTDRDGYPLYRRRRPEEVGFSFVKRVRVFTIENGVQVVRMTNVTIDNRYVVPYSPLLCRLFDAHINLESCASISAMKYICKYIYKGSDQSIFAVTGAQTESNEVLEYQRGRYISSNEAVWRILGFPIHRRHPMVRSTGDIALSTASSGIAATLLHGGRTAHSTLKLPLDLTRNEVPVCNLNADSAMGEVLRQCKFIVWDECTMAHRHALEAVDITLKDCRQDQRPMGGVVFLLAGDFRQILPTIPRGTIADELYAYLKASPLWSFVEILTLSTNMRGVNSGDPNSLLFSQFLLQLGSGQLYGTDEKHLRMFDWGLKTLDYRLLARLGQSRSPFSSNFNPYPFLPKESDGSCDGSASTRTSSSTTRLIPPPDPRGSSSWRDATVRDWSPLPREIRLS